MQSRRLICLPGIFDPPAPESVREKSSHTVTAHLHSSGIHPADIFGRGAAPDVHSAFDTTKYFLFDRSPHKRVEARLYPGCDAAADAYSNRSPPAESSRHSETIPAAQPSIPLPSVHTFSCPLPRTANTTCPYNSFFSALS